MGTIQSQIGLITGIPIGDTVEQLIGISARPRDLLVERTVQLRQEQVAVSELTALVLAVEFSMDRFGDESLFDQKLVSSSDEALLSATVNGSPAPGDYLVTPVRPAQTHQLVSQGLRAADRPLGGGTFSFRFGGRLNRPVLLEELNGGRAVQRGQIQITDRSGSSAVIDLRFAHSLDDVLESINGNQRIQVEAVVRGDALQLVDHSDQELSNLQVRQVGRATTAADLGLAGIDAAQDAVLGDDIIGLHPDLALRQLNDGNGVDVRAGVADLEVSLFDGSTLQIDFAAEGQVEETLGQVLATINAAAPDRLRAQIAPDGDRLELVDLTTDAGGTLAVKSLFGGSVAEDLGWVTGQSAGSSSAGSAYRSLVDQARAEYRAAAAAAKQQLDAGSSQAVYDAQLAAARQVRETAILNAAEAFGVSNDEAARDAANAGNILAGRRVQAGLASVLLGSLRGGQGLGPLTDLSLTDRSGLQQTVSLAGAETLDQILQTINAAEVAIRAEVNHAGNGIVLTDLSGGSGNLVVADVGEGQLAESLGIRLDAAVDQVASGSLDRQVVSRATRLTDYNNGQGVALGSLTIVNSLGQKSGINLAMIEARTVGDVIDEINSASQGVQASINAWGDGIALTDLAGGNQTLLVEDSHQGTAADLGFTQQPQSVTLGGLPAQVIQGRTTRQVQLDENDTLEDLVQKINELDGGVSASLFQDGSSSAPYRLALVSQTAGRNGQLLLDSGSLPLTWQESSSARDALLVAGSTGSLGAGVLVSSDSDQFKSVIHGLTLTVEGSSELPVNVHVEATDQKLLEGARLFVNSFNKLRDKLDELTAFDPETNTTGLLFGSGLTLRIESDLARLLSGRLGQAGAIQSLEELGIGFQQNGKLKLDETKLHGRWGRDADDVQRFFTSPDSGVVDQLHAVIETLAGEGHSALVNRAEALDRRIGDNDRRVEQFNERLQFERERLLKKFYAMELAIAKIQQSQQAIQRLAVLASQQQAS